MSQRRRWATVIIAGAAHALLYAAPSRYPIFVPSQLPLTAVDRAVPLIPETIWIYLSDYPLVVTAFFACRRPRRFLESFLGVTAVAVLFHWLIPIEFPRALFPVADAHGLAERALGVLRRLDGPGSCFPSLHVALPTVSLLAVARAPPARHPRAVVGLFTLWTAVVGLSTLTLKQHYAVDALGGLALAALVDALTAPGLGERLKAAGSKLGWATTGGRR